MMTKSPITTPKRQTPTILTASCFLLFIAAATTTVYAAQDKVLEKIAEPETSLLSTILGNLWATFCVVGPILQYFSKLKEPTTLSPYVVLVLLLSNIIRVFYWLATPFEISLLLQSIVMIMMMTLLVNETCKVYKTQVQSGEKKKTTLINDGITLDNVWMWTDIQSYQFFIGIVTAPFVLGALLFPEGSASYGALLGYLALLIEAMMGMPQLYMFYKNGARGENPVLYVTWLVGDLAKTAAFIATGANFPFIACGLVQTLVDIIIIGQIIVDTYIKKGGGDNDNQKAAKAA